MEHSGTFTENCSLDWMVMAECVDRIVKLYAEERLAGNPLLVLTDGRGLMTL